MARRLLASEDVAHWKWNDPIICLILGCSTNFLHNFYPSSFAKSLLLWTHELQVTQTELGNMPAK